MSLGDFDDMKERRMIRIFMPYSKTLYYIDKGQEKGLSIELARDFEAYINKKYKKELGNRPITVFIIPTSIEYLIDNIITGKGDIAAGNLTFTRDRAKRIDFVGPKKQRGNTELVITHKSGPTINTIEELSGKTVSVRRSTSYYDSLLKLNKSFEAAGKPLIKLQVLPDDLSDEDKLEMVNAGILKIVIVDDIIAKAWEKILPNIKVNYKAFVRENGKSGWMIRKNSPKLASELEDFFIHYVEKTNVNDVRYAQTLEKWNQLKNNTQSSETEKFQSILKIFKKYGARYKFDPLMLSAQGYQESKLDQNARSHVGAIGVMQIMPDTGKQMKVGDITNIEVNIHAGTKYMNFLMKTYFKGAKFNDYNRMLFALASYNAGAGKILKMREITAACMCGLDENKWFNNVEMVTGEIIGLETTTYVRNILKYYVSYRLINEEKNKNIKKIKK
ncbi:transporter substrate-binding domain-containing protein [Fluviispira multicolorata]|uniref:Transporter substrate-binding domain-containing protein n=2 Tax=Fluviispira multicolorata TaxID=2654512 RepID=A0A833JB60_9BACT|nr:transporter substrate-binding domain-containing protein [Fluviispira multicolorata]